MGTAYVSLAQDNYFFRFDRFDSVFGIPSPFEKGCIPSNKTLMVEIGDRSRP
jgi:hypothetical protein